MKPRILGFVQITASDKIRFEHLITLLTIALRPASHRQNFLHPLALIPFLVSLWIFPSLVQAQVKEEPSPHQIQQWIEHLGHSHAAVRDQAQRSLAASGIRAFTAIGQAQQHSDPEVAFRARHLMSQIKIPIHLDTDPEAVVFLLRGYNESTEVVREVQLRSLAALPQGEGIPALLRMIEFEKSPRLAKLGILNVFSATRPPNSGQAMSVLQAIRHDSKRLPAADWLQNYLLENTDPNLAIERWQALIQAEHELLQTEPHESGADVVSELQLHLNELLLRNERVTESDELMQEILQLKSPAILANAVQRLIEHHRWANVKTIDLARKDVPLEPNPLLLHLIHHSYETSGDSELADKIANELSELNSSLPVGVQLQTARQLMGLGHHQRARAEFQRIISSTSGERRNITIARLMLAELLHDQQSEEAAAEQLSVVAASLNRDPGLERWVITALQRTPESILARMHYFRARHALSIQQLNRVREECEKALKVDPSDIDVLIMLHQLPDQSDAQRQKLTEQIRLVANSYRKETQSNPKDSTAYNQFAWLIANTQGDFHEALAFSQTSLELTPGASGQLDTLAHCYFALKDYPNAIRYQTVATKLEPHTKQLQQTLKRFRSALE